jgi:hypothetical protein
LDKVVERIVVEIVWMKSNHFVLHPGSDEGQHKPSKANQHTSRARPHVRKPKHDQQKRNCRQIVEDDDVKLLRNEKHGYAVSDELHSSRNGDPTRSSRRKLYIRTDRPHRQRCYTDRQQSYKPEKRVPRRPRIKKKTVDHPSHERSQAKRTEKQREPVSKQLPLVSFARKQVREQGTFDGQAIVGEGDIRFRNDRLPVLSRSGASAYLLQHLLTLFSTSKEGGFAPRIEPANSAFLYAYPKNQRMAKQLADKTSLSGDVPKKLCGTSRYSLDSVEDHWELSKGSKRTDFGSTHLTVKLIETFVPATSLLSIEIRPPWISAILQAP